MKISKPIQYVIAIGGLLAVALILWNVYNNYQENNSASEAIAPTAPIAKSPTTAATPAPAKAPSAPVGTSPAPAAKAPSAPVAKNSPAPAAKASVLPVANPFHDAVNKAMSAAELTQTAKTKAQWSTVITDWQQSIGLMEAVPKNNPHYRVAQQKAVEYQSKKSYAQEAQKLAK